MQQRKYFTIILILAFLMSSTFAQEAAKKEKLKAATPQAAGNPVTGSGTSGQLTKWTGVDGSNTYTVGNSTITEDKFGNVGVGTKLPTSRLTVAGVIQSSIGGFKFPDGTIQMTAGIANVTHDATLTGNGTVGAPLGVAVPLALSGAVGLLDAIIKASNTGTGAGLFGESTNGDGVVGTSNTSFGVNAKSSGNGTATAAVKGTCVSCVGIFGESTSSIGVRGDSTNSAGVLGRSTNSDGVSGLSTNGTGVFGKSTDVAGVRGQSTNGPGVLGESGNSHAVQGSSASNSPNNAGVAGFSSSIVAGGIAGRFGGNVRIEPNNGQPGDLVVAGKLQVTSGMKMFHIDHPLDPENKYLNHAAIESSEVLNVYSGNVITNADGEAVVTLPDWFEALNSDFRYQLTVLGTFAQAIVADEIKNHRFAIKTNAANVKVSWQVTGVRSDPTARKFKFDIEEEKSKDERGFYLNPDAFGQSEEKSIQWARDPEGMQQLRQRRIEAEQMRKPAKPNQR